MHPIRHVDAHLVSTHEFRPRIVGRYWASDAGDCKRKLYFMYTNEEPTDPLDAHTVRKLGYGKKIEEQEIEWLYASGNAIDDHVKFNKLNPEAKTTIIAGEVDTILETVDGVPYIGEIKTGYGPMFKNKVLLGRPNLRHILQGMMYLTLSDYDDLVYMYIDRGTCDRTEHHLTLENGYPVVNNETISSINVTTIYKVFAQLHKMISNNILPAPDFKQEYEDHDVHTLRRSGKLTTAQYNKWKAGESIGDWECKGCIFRSLCADS